MTGRRMWAGAAALLMTALTPSVLPTDAALTGTCTLDQLVPTVRATTVNQGLSTYPNLIQGKETLVRLFLTKPSCAGDSDQIAITGGEVTVTGAPAVGTGVMTPPASSTTPAILGSSTSYANDSPSNPLFVVPGSVLAAASGEYTATFTARVRFQAKQAADATFGPERELAVAPISKPVNAASNVLRVLVVPMGDSRLAPALQFPAAASDAVQRGMLNLQRMLPVREGVGALGTAGSVGLRYSVVPNVLDLGPNGLKLMDALTVPVKKFCGKASTFDAIKPQLAAFLQNWNTANPGAKADRVIGAVWQDWASGVADGSGCEEGRAMVNGAEAWIRATSDSTGAVTTMEVLHTLGAATGSNSDGNYHSKNVQADLTDPDRAYNLLLDRYLPDDRSALKLSSPGWVESSALLEPPDWEQARCRLTPTAKCSTSTALGSAATGASLVITGIIDVAASGEQTPDLETWYTGAAVDQTDPDDTSHYAVTQLTAGRIEVRRTRIPALTDHTHHDDHTHSGVAPGDVILDAAVAAHADAEIFQVQFQRAADDWVTLYERRINAQPTISVYSEPAVKASWDFTPATPTQSQAAPAISPDGQLVAWNDGSLIRFAARGANGAAAQPYAATLVGSDPAWFDDDGTLRLAYVNADGDVLLTTVSTSQLGLGFGPIVPAYLAAAQVFPDGKASAPSWSPAGDRLAVSIGKDIWQLAVDFIPGNEPICQIETEDVAADDLDACSAVSRTADDEQRPAWGRRWLAFDVNGSAIRFAESVDDQWTVTSTTIAGRDPAWSNGRLLFARANGIFAAYEGALTSPPVQLTTLADGAPSSDALGRFMAFSRSAAVDSDVWLAEIVSSGTLVVEAEDEMLADLRGDLFVVCGTAAGERVTPVIVDVDPVVEGGLARFRMTYDAKRACADPILRVRVTDGWLTTIRDLPVEGGDAPPSASVAAPLPNDVFTQWESIPIAGSAIDDGGTVTYRWSLVYPDGSEHVVPGNAPVLPDQAPPSMSSGWPVGSYRVKLVVTDGNDQSADPVTVPIVVVEDKDNDGIPKDRDRACGTGADRDRDPTNAYSDSDGDTVLDVDDPAPCSSGFNLSVNFDPDTLELKSTGTPITIYLKPTVSSFKMADVDPKTVAISRIGGLPVWFTQTAWSISSKTGVATAQFSRPDVIAFMQQQPEMIGKYVPVLVQARTNGGTVALGLDASAPKTSLS